MRPIVLLFFATAALSAADVPLRALLICGGCCHDYARQSILLRDGIQARADVQVDVVLSDVTGTKPWFPMYLDKDWAKGYDVIIHDECAADVTDPGYVQNIIDAHKNGVPAVNLHCAMHGYRTGKDGWFEFLGVQSTGHGWQKPIAIDFSAAEHPVTHGMANWTTIDEELYNNVKVFPTAKPLALGTQEQGSGGKDTTVVAWTNDFHGTRVFNTTLGHNNTTVNDARYLDLIVRGLLWSCNKLDEAHLHPYAGPKGRFEKVSGEAPEEKPQAVAGNAEAVVVTASSTQGGNEAWKAVDGRKSTRWCADGESKPQWLQLEFAQARPVNGVKIVWETSENWYQYRIEGSTDGKEWKVLADATGNRKPGDTANAFAETAVKFLRVTCTATSWGWACIRELQVEGPGLAAIQAKLPPGEERKADDTFQHGGNSRPKITKLTAEQEASILKDVKVADGFDLSLFATPSAANYPVYVAAAPNGDLYVSSDGNGSLGRDPDRGRIVRLRDTDHDGRADQVTEFVKNVDSPRGLVWDHDRLYLVHPPDVSVYIDHDGDGQADEEKTLIKGIAFGFKDRPADHTTNGLSMGIDGWLYIAGGDFGFMDAVGTDGRHLQHRGGGVIRFRPDGSGLEIFSTGTRNILGTPISPLLDLFARDNTNDGGGWDVRFHNFTGLEDHGYPRLYMNFGEEHVKPLADYGGGSGCGSVYLSEPGFPKHWNDAPLTCDWGTGALWKHTVERTGATFAETAKPEPLIRMTRPTDADVDGLSHLYQASWKGATFNWEGTDVGYIVRVSPQGYTPEPLPDFDKTDDAGLIRLLESPSQVRTLEAQRTLLRRPVTPAMTQALIALAGNAAKPLPGRIAALYALAGRGVTEPTAAAVIQQIAPLAAEPALQPFVLRALADCGLDALGGGKTIAPVEPYAAGLKSADPRTRLEATIGATRQHMKPLASAIAGQLGDADPVIAHTAFRALSMLGAADACFAVIDRTDAPSAQRTGAAFALMRMHTPEVVQGLISRLDQPAQAAGRRDLLEALCRLYFHEGEWKGDSWGTRPDTRGPYYQPEPWSETPKIAAALKAELAKATAVDAGFLVREMRRNRIESNEALDRLLTLAKENPELAAEAVGQLATAETIPASAIPVLVQAAGREGPPALLAQAVTALAKTDSAEGCAVSLKALDRLDDSRDSRREREQARQAFLAAPKLENHHQLLETLAAKMEGGSSTWADAALLALSARQGGSPEARELSKKALELGWEQPKRRVQILQAIRLTDFHGMDDRVLVAAEDPDAAVAKEAQETARRLKLEKKGEDKTPLVGSLKPDEVIAAILQTKGSVALGEQLFTRQTCVACHATRLDQPQKGPFLGTIAQTYTREELARNILDPGRTIAQGFATELFTMKDGSAQMGFVTFESAAEVKIRTIAAQEFTLKTAEIAKRDKLPNSLMPQGLVDTISVRDFASLLDYLESLSKKE